jgi:hypothetical protein
VLQNDVRHGYQHCKRKREGSRQNFRGLLVTLRSTSLWYSIKWQLLGADHLTPLNSLGSQVTATLCLLFPCFLYFCISSRINNSYWD